MLIKMSLSFRSGSKILFVLRVGERLREAQQVVCRYPKVGADCLDILQTRFILTPLQIGDFALGHIQKLSKFRLIQFLFFPEKLQLFSKGKFHKNHRDYFIIDR